jgi:peptidoglycan/xylan/chitin deacetylase (PgdA/CDA1 family)
MSPTFVALSAFGTLGFVYAAVPKLLLQASRWRLGSRCRRRRAIALTFDDGPGSQMTPMVLERLAQAGVPATFFLLGHNVHDNFDLVVDLQRRGHEVGTHGNLHVHHVWLLPWVGMLDTRDGWRRLAGVLSTPERAMPFRPPYGKMNLLSLLWLWWHGAPVAMWTHDSQDTWQVSSITPEVFADSVRRAGGGVVLLHDFDRDSEAGSGDVLARLDAVLRLRGQGFQFVTMTDLAGEG